MAKNANELNRKVLQNLRTKKSSEFIAASLSGIAAEGEIIVQFPNEEGSVSSGTSLWTLAQDGKTAVQFVNKETVQNMIEHGAVEEVDKIETAVGLSSAGTYVQKSGTNYLDEASTVEGEIAALDEVLGTTNNYIQNLDASSVADDNKVVSDVVQNEGQITATAKNITDVKIGGYQEGSDAKVAETDTLGQALGKLQGQINAMDKQADAETGHIVTTVSETDGKVSETKALLKDIVLSGYTKTADEGAIANTDTVEEALSKLENKVGANKITNEDGSIIVTEPTGTATTTDVKVQIKSGERVIKLDASGSGIYTDIKISAASASELAELGTNVREAYKLLDSDGERLGDWIKIYKDSALANVELGHIGDLLYGTTAITEESDSSVIVPTSDSGASEALNFVYQLEDGKYKLAQVNLETFLQESEFKDGLTVNANHEVRVLIDSNSEAFLTVGPDGLKLSGVEDAIKDAVNALNADVTGTSSDNHVTVEVVEVSGVVTDVVVTTDDIASAQGLANEIARATSAETQLDAVIGAVKGASEARTYSHSGTNYLDSNDKVKEDVETLDTLLGKSDIGNSAETVFDSTNTVAKSISDIKKALDAFEHQSELTVVDDNKYIDAQVSTAETGTTIGVSAITKSIALSTSGDSALADSYDVKQFAVSAVKDDSTGSTINVSVVTENDVRKIDFTNMVIDCGTF